MDSNLKLSEVIRQVSGEKGVDQAVLIETLEVAIATAAKRVFGQAREIEAYYNEESDEIELFQILQVSEDIDNIYRDITLEDAIDHEFTDVGVGDELLVQIFYLDKDVALAREQDAKYGSLLNLESAKMSFGRIAAQTAKQVILQRMREAEQDIIYNMYKDREGELITGVVRRFERTAIIVDLEHTDAILPAREQTPRESYRPGDRIQAYVKKVQRSSKDPQIILSRTEPDLVVKLFQQSVPEIDEGIVQILRVSRQPGMRTKVAVYSSQNDVDPVGACVGMRGQRVQTVVQELRGEKIDIVPFNEEPARFVCSAISPAEVSKVLIDEAKTSMELIVPDDQLSLAIGRGGQNVRLAAQLTGWNLDIISESRLSEIRQDVKRALMSHGIEDENLIDTLFTLGYNKLEQIASVDPLEFAQIPGFGMDNAELFVKVASDILAETQKARPNKEQEKLNISDIALYLGISDVQAKKFYSAGYRDLNILFLENNAERLDAKTSIGINKAPQIIQELEEIAINQEVYTKDELTEARETFNRSLKEIPNCTLQQAYNCTVEQFGERPFPPVEDDDLDEAEDVNANDEEVDDIE